MWNEYVQQRPSGEYAAVPQPPQFPQPSPSRSLSEEDAMRKARVLLQPPPLHVGAGHADGAQLLRQDVWGQQLQQLQQLPHTQQQQQQQPPPLQPPPPQLQQRPPQQQQQPEQQQLLAALLQQLQPQQLQQLLQQSQQSQQQPSPCALPRQPPPPPPPPQQPPVSPQQPSPRARPPHQPPPQYSNGLVPAAAGPSDSAACADCSSREEERVRREDALLEAIAALREDGARREAELRRQLEAVHADVRRLEQMLRSQQEQPQQPQQPQQPTQCGSASPHPTGEPWRRITKRSPVERAYPPAPADVSW